MNFKALKVDHFLIVEIYIRQWGVTLRCLLVHLSTTTKASATLFDEYNSV